MGIDNAADNVANHAATPQKVRTDSTPFSHSIFQRL
jgi:hypothetical protein